jgi:hypothetical protein
MQRILMRAMSNLRCWWFHRAFEAHTWVRPEMVCMDANYGQGVCGKIKINFILRIFY